MSVYVSKQVCPANPFWLFGTRPTMIVAVVGEELSKDAQGAVGVVNVHVSASVLTKRTYMYWPSDHIMVGYIMYQPGTVGP